MSRDAINIHPFDSIKSTLYGLDPALIGTPNNITTA